MLKHCDEEDNHDNYNQQFFIIHGELKFEKKKTCRCHSEKNNDKNKKSNGKIKQLEGCKIKGCKK
jgi:hypothetical protein